MWTERVLAGTFLSVVLSLSLQRIVLLTSTHASLWLKGQLGSSLLRRTLRKTSPSSRHATLDCSTLFIFILLDTSTDLEPDFSDADWNQSTAKRYSVVGRTVWSSGRHQTTHSFTTLSATQAMSATNALMLPFLLVCRGSFVNVTPTFLAGQTLSRSKHIFDSSLCLSRTSEILHCFPTRSQLA